MPLPGNVFPPEVNDPTGEYERPLNPNTEGAAAVGFYPQNATSADATTGIERDSAGNLVLRDGNNGTNTLAASLLEVDPTDADCYSVITEVDDDVTRIDWKYAADDKLKKRTDFTYTDGEVTLETIKVYAADGSTVIAQLEISYDYSTEPIAITRNRVI